MGRMVTLVVHFPPSVLVQVFEGKNTSAAYLTFHASFRSTTRAHAHAHNSPTEWTGPASRCLFSPLPGRCCGQTAVKGSAKTTLFDFVHLGLHKSGGAAAASSSATSSSTAAASKAEAGNALKQIVLTGGAGRNRLVLELDGGNAEAEANVVQTWFEVGSLVWVSRQIDGA